MDNEQLIGQYAAAQKRAEQDAYDAAAVREAKARARRESMVNPRRR